MGYFGPTPKGTSVYLSGTGTGDGSIVAFPMGFTARADAEVIVTIDGVIQHTNLYTISGSTCTFSAAPANGVAIEFRILQSLGFVAEVGDGVVNQSKIDTSSLNPIVQTVYEERRDYANLGSSTAIYDDTIPQITEGVSYDTITITPTKIGNRLVFDVQINILGSAAGTPSICLFKQGTTDCISQTFGQYFHIANMYQHATARFELDADTDTATVYEIRLLTSNTMNLYLNGDASSRYYGGALVSSITVTEIAQ